MIAPLTSSGNGKSLRLKEEVIDASAGPQGNRAGAVSHLEGGAWRQHDPNQREGLACTKAICNYIHDTYGRFPSGTDAMHLMWLMQAHHIDTDHYDRFFGPGALKASARGAHGDLTPVRSPL
jgi:hypothetical protein